MYCYIEFKLRYLKNLIFFQLEYKNYLSLLFCGKKADGSLLFLKAFSWETDIWFTFKVILQ